jgi:ADP-dependent NAD(P)H-hydrate dehydratase
MKREQARPVRVNAALLRGWRLPAIEPELGKVGRGKVLIIGGALGTPGAVMLAGIAALHAGAGRLQLATALGVAALVAVDIPEARVFGLRQGADGELTASSCREIQDKLNACDALLIGPGMVEGRAVKHVLSTPCAGTQPHATVVDAGALGFFRKAGSTRHGLIFTPHAGEMAQLMDIERDRVAESPFAIASAAARRHDAVVVLKGARTVIAAPDGRLFENTAGGIGLGTSGSGDVLAGLITGLCARGAEPLQAAVWGVHLHALAGERLAKKIAPLGFLARDLSAQVPALLNQFDS